MKKNEEPPSAPKWLWPAFLVVSVATALMFILPRTDPRTIQQNSPLDPNLGVENPRVVSQLKLREQADHPVTDSMRKAADSLEAVKAPEFSLPDGEGKVHSLASLTAGGKPLLIFFIEKNCPCCLGAKFFMDRLAGLYRESAQVIGIINGTPDEARAWRTATNPKFLILEDPYQKTITAFKAERGVYTTLIRPDGTVEKAYPGYSVDVIDDMSKRMAKLAGVPYQPYRSPAAPKRLTSGCLFPEPPKPPKEPTP